MVPGISMVVRIFRPVTVIERRTQSKKVFNKKRKKKKKKKVQENKIISLTQNCCSMFIVCFGFSVKYFCLHQTKLDVIFAYVAIECCLLTTCMSVFLRPDSYLKQTQHEILMSVSKHFCLFDEKNDA